MTPYLPRARARSGITLTEILISILIMGVGMISLAVLFPIGLLRLHSAAKLTRGTFLAESAINDFKTRDLLTIHSFTNTYFSPWYGGANPWVQDTAIAGGAFRTIGKGLPVAYDPLWRYQTNFPAGYYTGTDQARFASGIGFVRTDPDGNPASAYGLQRITNFNPANYAPLVANVGNPLATANPVPDIFVSPEDIVFPQDDLTLQNATNVSAVVPDLGVPDPVTGQPSGVPTNDWRYTWFFTGQLSDVGQTASFQGDIVICENRQFNIASVPAPLGGGDAQSVADETVVEGIFGFSTNVWVNSSGSGAGGYGNSADHTVLLRWPTGMDDPEVKVGRWIADVTYELVATTDASRMSDVKLANPPLDSNGIPVITPITDPVPPMQRCHWYQVAKTSPPGPDVLGVAGYRSMTVWTVAPLQAQTLLSPSTGMPVHVNAVLIMPCVANVYTQSFYMP